MGKPAARVGDLHVCPFVTPSVPPVPHVGGPILPPGCPTVLIGGQPAARMGDMATCVGPPATIVMGSPTVLIGGQPVARMGDPTMHGGTITLGFPTVLIGEAGGGGGGGGGGGMSAITGPSPKTPAAAPETIGFSPEMNKAFKDLWGQSFPGGKSQEFGGTLVMDKSGQVSLVNMGGGTSGTFPPNRNVDADKTIVGVFHTHPYDASEGGATDVSLSGGDAAYMINKGDKAIIAQSGEGQFMFVRTDATPKNVDYTKMNDANNARVGQLVTEGKSFDEASQIAARETAEANGMAYYQGKDGQFTRVSPPVKP